MMAPRSKLAAAGAAVTLVAGIAVLALPPPDNDGAKPGLGLFTSLPIFWAESENIADMLGSAAPPHWARIALEADHRLVPLDTLGRADLQKLDRLVMAQPRPLAPAENVALDDWVRGGGRLLLFADPMLTAHSRFALGDRRRPQDVVLLSPILQRWGLELEFDEEQTDAERQVRFGEGAIPVRLAGTLRRVAPGAPAECALDADSVAARCAIGKGQVLVIADAAMLEDDRNGGASDLAGVVETAFAD
jgi:hypothetical protein